MEPGGSKNKGLEDSLELLRSEEDERRLVGLLLATKFISGDDLQSVRRVFDAVGFEFINRLLKTAHLGDGLTTAGTGAEADVAGQRQAYATLALSILSAFCRVPELAASPEMSEKVPVFFAFIRERKDGNAMVDAYECLLGLAYASEHGLRAVKEVEPLEVVATDIHLSAPDCPWLPLALKFLLLLFKSGVDDRDMYVHRRSFSRMVPVLARELAQRADDSKFDALALLLNILSSAEAAKVFPDNTWTADARTGLYHLLHSRIGDEQRRAALQLAKVAMEREGGRWLAGPLRGPTDQTLLPADRFFLVLVETLRVEVPVLLEDLARLIFAAEEEKEEGGSTEAGGGHSSAMVPRGRTALLGESASGERGSVSQSSQKVQTAERMVADCFAVLEEVIGVMAKAASEDAEGQGERMGEAGSDLSIESLEKAFQSVEEAIRVVLEFLELAKAHGRNVDNGVLACVRVVGRFLAEAPQAHNQRVLQLLSFMLSVRALDEETAAQSVQFLLPALLQTDGGALAKEGGVLSQIVKFVVEQARTNAEGALEAGEQSHAALVDACDILLNVLNSREHYAGFTLDAQDFTPLFAAAVAWTSAKGASEREAAGRLAMAACLVARVLPLATEAEVKTKLDGAARKELPKAMEVVMQFLEFGHKASGEVGPEAEEKDLWDITVASCIDALPNWPSLRRGLEKTQWWPRLAQRSSMQDRLGMLVKER